MSVRLSAPALPERPRTLDLSRLRTRAARVLQAMGHARSELSIALVSDAGTPGISDPGERIVRAVRAAGLRVESVPGPCALAAALPAGSAPRVLRGHQLSTRGRTALDSLPNKKIAI